MFSARHACVFLLGFSFWGIGYAQPQSALRCTTTGGWNLPVRAEGVAELTGDFIVVCTGGTPTALGAAAPAVDITLFLSGTSITSRRLEGGWSEVLLMVDEPAPGSLRMCGTAGDVEVEAGVCSITGTGTGAGVYNGSAGRPNVFQGFQIASNAIRFKGVPNDPPGASQRIFRIVNIRANANVFGVSAANPIPVSLFGTIFGTPFNLLPISGDATQAIGSVQRGNASSVVSVQNFKQCESQNAALAADPASNGVSQFSVRFNELFATSFGKRNIATTAANPNALADQDILGGPFYPAYTQSGFYHAAFPALTGRGATGLSGLATQSTRLMARFENIPLGVKLFAKATIALPSQSPTHTAQLVSTDINGNGPYTPVAANAFGIAPIPITNSTATLVYEIVEADPNNLALQFDVPIYVAYVANPASFLPQLGDTRVRTTFAPLSVATEANSTDPVPRFADTSTPIAAFSVEFCPCTTVATPPPTFSHTGGAGEISITAPQSCNWTAFSFADWMTVTSPTQNNGNGTVAYTVAPNPAGLSRSGDLWVGQDFTVLQNPAPCTYLITPSATFFGHLGGNGSLGIVAPVGCVWSITASPVWVNFTSTTSGAGNGNITFTVTASALATNRSAYFQIGGQQIDITQAGGAPAPLTKVAAFNPSQAVWVIDKNGNAGWEGPPTDGFFAWGSANDIPVSGDWNGSGVKKAGVFNPLSATWLLDFNGNGVWDGPGVDRLIAWGAPGDRPVVGNWNGVGTQDKIGTYNSTQAVFTLDFNGNLAWEGAGTDKTFVWGSPGDLPVTGDWNGSGATSIGIFNPSQGWWLIDANGNFTWDGVGTDRYLRWGSPGDTPIVGDWDGTGTAKLGAYNSAQSVFILDYNGNYTWDGPADRFFQWGSSGDKPVVGVWNAAGAAKIGVFNPSQGWWLLDYNGNFTWDGPSLDRFFRWGSPGDVPVAGRW